MANALARLKAKKKPTAPTNVPIAPTNVPVGPVCVPTSEALSMPTIEDIVTPPISAPITAPETTPFTCPEDVPTALSAAPSVFSAAPTTSVAAPMMSPPEFLPSSAPITTPEGVSTVPTTFSAAPSTFSVSTSTPVDAPMVSELEATSSQEGADSDVGIPLAEAVASFTGAPQVETPTPVSAPIETPVTEHPVLSLPEPSIQELEEDEDIQFLEMRTDSAQATDSSKF